MAACCEREQLTPSSEAYGLWLSAPWLGEAEQQVGAALVVPCSANSCKLQ